MSKFYRIQIDDFYLTSDGTATGLPCRLAVSGVAALRAQFLKTVTQNADGSFVVQTYDYAANKPLEIQIQSLPSNVGNLIVDLFNSLENVSVVGTGGETGDFTATCEIVSFDYKDFRAGNWKNAILKLMTV